MATIQDIRDGIAIVLPLAHELSRAARDLTSFAEDVYRQVSEDNPYSGTIDADAFIAIQLSLYNGLLAEIESAADALGTDAF